MQLASFLEDPQYQDQHSLHTEIIKTFGRVGPNAEPRFRDECKLRWWEDVSFFFLSQSLSLAGYLDFCCYQKLMKTLLYSELGLPLCPCFGGFCLFVSLFVCF